ncbi:hypothetical protein NL676_009346 [Syzygium grande]|nr:hypothetical protein NL676_009346 [Syzygium grande]
MERFVQAAERGNIEVLEGLIRRNVNNLKAIADERDGYMLLHDGCAADHLNLVQQLLGCMPEFAHGKDTDGLSPLHIAVARGHAEIADELLRGRRHLCSVKGLEDRIPLHSAIVNGELDVIERLLVASPNSIRETTAQKETALHLAIKNNQFGVVVVLLEQLTHDNTKEVINWNDNKGNAALHLAVAVRNFEVVDRMLSLRAQGRMVVEVNAYNNSGRTPLDFSRREGGDREIREILARAGAIRGRGRYSSLVLEGESKADTRNALLVIAGLIVNATYQSVL